MTNDGGTLRNLLSGGDTSQELTDAAKRAVEQHLEPDEGLEFEVPGKATVTRESDGETTDLGDGDGGSLLAVTDRQVLLVVYTPDDETVIDAHYTDIRNIELDSSFLKTTLVLDVWDDGSYRFRPRSSDTAEAAVEYVDSVSDAWQFCETLLDELEGQTSTIGSHVEAGRLDQAESVLEDAHVTMAELEERNDRAELGDVFAERARRAERELHRTRIHARLSRAKTLVTEAKHQTDATNYTGAYQRYDRARDHLEDALDIAAEHGFDDPPRATAEIEHIESRMKNLEVRPMALAKQATERALGTNHADEEVDAWADALEHYRDALTTGWGTSFDTAGDKEELRTLAEGAVDNLIQAHKNYAAELEMKAEQDAERGNVESARDHYENALDELDAAQDLAREFRSGDPDVIAEQKNWLEWNLEAL